MSDRTTNQTTAELYAACRNDVLAEHPSAREVARGMTYVAIMAGKELLGSGSTADQAWADAYGRMTGQLTCSRASIAEDASNG